jgi:transposase
VPNFRLRSEGIGYGHAYSAAGVTDVSHDTNCSPARQTKTTKEMNIDYAALVALDWGETTHAFGLRMSGRDAVENGQIEATPEALHGWLEQLGSKCAGRPVAMAVEAGRNALLHALLEYRWLTIYPVHSATSARFRKAFVPSGAKDDLPDALVLLTLLERHREQLKPLLMDTLATRELAAMVKARRDAVDRRNRAASELGGTLKAYFPQALKLIGDDLTKPMALAFLRRFPELAAVKKMRPAALRSFYCDHNVRSEERIAERLELAQQARPLLQDRAVIEPAILEVALLVDSIEVYNRHLREWDERIAELFAAHPRAELFANLPGAGAAFAPRLLVAFGDRPERYPDAQSLQKYAGIAPVLERSGRRSWIHWRWCAPTFLRQTFVEWAGQTVIYCDWAKAYYFRQKQAGKARQSILRALAFKWIRILWKCWQTNTPYDPGRYRAALLGHRSPLAGIQISKKA